MEDQNKPKPLSQEEAVKNLMAMNRANRRRIGRKLHTKIPGSNRCHINVKKDGVLTV